MMLARNASGMMRSIIVSLLLGLSPAAVQTARAIDSPRQLAAACETVIRGKSGAGDDIKIPNTRDALLCWGYMQAMQDLSVLAFEDGTRLLGACPPENTTLLQLIRSYVKYARGHPNDLEGSTAVAVINAFHEAYPCSQAKAGE
jgi:hypothetical protein